MHVYKFGGASLATPERLRNVFDIISKNQEKKTIVVSAIGKTTNELEVIVKKAVQKDMDTAKQLVKQLENKHVEYVNELQLSESVKKEVLESFNTFFTELQWAVEESIPEKFDYCYDQIVCLGELLSSVMAYAYLKDKGVQIKWVDARDLIRTDETFREGVVDEPFSQKQVKTILLPLFEHYEVVLTQGFIGATSDNHSVTLGREGSDYTAALIASMANAEDVTIWKDVEGLKNADPKLFPNTVKIESISYHEVIEMAYYGAQIIHPKTIKPLKTSNIPLYVRSFLDPEAKGSKVCAEVDTLFYPPLITTKKQQTLLQITSKDFSFIGEDAISHIYSIFHQNKIRVNLIQNAAISFVACMDHNDDKIKKVVDALQTSFKVFRNEDLELITIRHYTSEIVADLVKNRVLLVEQKTRHTIQLVVK